MYTVLRFTAIDGDLRLIHELVTRPCPEGQCGSIRDSSFACDVSDADSWETQLQDVGEMLRRLGPVLFRVQQCGGPVRVSLDVAVEPEDRGNRPYLPIVFPHALLDTFVRTGIALEVTSYA
jgi:hypothetical protein